MARYEVSVVVGEGEVDVEPVECDYVSWINQATYGAPPLLTGQPATKGGEAVKAKPGQTIAFINTAVVPAAFVKVLSE